MNKKQVISLCIIVTAGLLAIFAMGTALKAGVVQAAPVKVGLVTATDTLAAKGFSWMGYQGLLRAEQELGVVGTVYTTTDSSEIEPNILACAHAGNNFCIAIGFDAAEAISNTAGISPTVKFAVVDVAFEHYPDNLRGLVFASEDGAYLAGTLAALMSQSNVIGDLGGVDIPPVIAYTEGYSNGAHCANPGVTTIISYTNTFSEPLVGAEYAQKMIARGADVVFAAAGNTGNGAILTTTQSGVWAIGVDSDQYITLFMSGTVPGADRLLTSAMKRVDTAVFDSITDVVDGNFTPGTITYNLAMNGVGLAPFHEADDAIPSAVKTRLEWVSRAIIGGAIQPLDPLSPCLVVHQQFLPSIRR